MAEITKNPDWCGNLPRNDWIDPINTRCRKNVAIKLQDPKICGADVGLEYTEWMLEGTEEEKEYIRKYQEKDKCYLNYSKHYIDPKVCIYIVDKEVKQECLNSTK